MTPTKRQRLLFELRQIVTRINSVLSIGEYEAINIMARLNRLRDEAEKLEVDRGR